MAIQAYAAPFGNWIPEGRPGCGAAQRRWRYMVAPVVSRRASTELEGRSSKVLVILWHTMYDGQTRTTNRNTEAAGAPRLAPAGLDHLALSVALKRQQVGGRYQLADGDN